MRVRRREKPKDEIHPREDLLELTLRFEKAIESYSETLAKSIETTKKAEKVFNELNKLVDKASRQAAYRQTSGGHGRW